MITRPDVMSRQCQVEGRDHSVYYERTVYADKVHDGFKYWLLQLIVL